MPNHVTHRLKVIGPSDDLATFRRECFDDEGQFDFGRIISMPEVVAQTEAGSDGDAGFALLCNDGLLTNSPGTRSVLDWGIFRNAGVLTVAQALSWAEENRPQMLSEGAKCKAAFEATGHHSWYEWSIANWGTKWNAYQTRIVNESHDAFEMTFETAWSVPRPIFAALHERFPRLRFEVASFDEGWNFAAMGVYSDRVSECVDVDATDEMYLRVYGHPPEKDEE